MINLRRGFRRLFLVLSVVWAAGSGFYLWRLPPASPSSVDYDAIAAEVGGVPTGAAHELESLSVEEWESRYKIPLRELDVVLRQLTPDQRTAARDAFTSSNNEDDLAERLNGMTLPKEVKARLWDLKAGRLARSSSWRDAPVILPTAEPGAAGGKWETVSGPSPSGGDVFDLDSALAREKARKDENGNPKPARPKYLSTDPNAGLPVKPMATPTPPQIRTWLEIGLIPPLVVFALLEGLLWAGRGFSAKQAVSKPED